MNIISLRLVGRTWAEPSGAVDRAAYNMHEAVRMQLQISNKPKSSVLIGMIDPALTKTGISDRAKFLVITKGPVNISPLNHDR